MLHSKSEEKILVLFGNPIKSLNDWEKSKINFTGPAVPVSGTLKFGGAGPVGPLREISKKRPVYD